MDAIDPKKLDNVLTDIAPSLYQMHWTPEVVTQFRDHQKFLISGLDNKEEFRSRLAFTDAYKNEFEELHEKLRKAYDLPKGEHEFDYLASPQFREATATGKSVVYDMMKDYLTYKQVKGEISEKHCEELLKDEPEAEREFRSQKLTEQEKDFLIDDSAFEPEKQQGLRECRKWMYRNCSKSGAMNETGTKRNFIDSFGKRSVAEQINTLYQVEGGYYKYSDPSKKQEKPALDDKYVPSLDGFKDKMVRGKINPYRWWKKATGDLFYWTRMERALKKTDEMKEQIRAEYEKQEERFNEKYAPKSDKEIKKEPAKTAPKPKEDDPLIYITDEEFLDFYEVASNDFMKALDNYSKESTPEKFKEVQEQARVVQRMYKNNAYREVFNENPDLKNKAFEFAKFTRQVETAGQDITKINNVEIQKDATEKHFDKTADLAISIKDKLGLVYTGVSKVIENTDTVKNISSGLAIVGCVTSGYSMVKNYAMAIKTARNEKLAKDIKEKNQQDRKKDVDLIGLDPNSKEVKNAKDAQQINDMAKVSKKRNAMKKATYVVAGSCAAASCALGITGVATTVGLPVTIAAGVVAGIGFGAGYVMNNVTNKNPAKKSIDSAMKLDDKDYEVQYDETGKKKRYIETKMDERKEMVQEKQGRFREGTANRENADYYLKKPDKLKDRIRTNYAVEHGKMTMYTFRDAKDKDNANIAYRHVFLRNPDGPIDENNLLKPSEVKLYMSQKPEDLQKTGQDAKEAEKRETYMQLLKSEGFKLKAPKNVTEAKQLFDAKDQKGEPVKNAPENEELSALDKQVAEEEKSQKRINSARKQVLGYAENCGKLLQRLEKAGEGKDKKGYQDLRSALQEASQLDDHSTPAQVRQSFQKLAEAGKQFAQNHSGIFQGIVGSGKERCNVANYSMTLVLNTLKDFRENAKGMNNQQSFAYALNEQERKLQELSDARKELTGEKQKEKQKAEQMQKGMKQMDAQRQQEQEAKEKDPKEKDKVKG